jgi:hypothetical protein
MFAKPTKWPLHSASILAKRPPLWQFPRVRELAPHAFLRCRSSVVEHSLGKGEVDSSILSGSTTPITSARSSSFARARMDCGEKYLPRWIDRGPTKGGINYIRRPQWAVYLPPVDDAYARNGACRSRAIPGLVIRPECLLRGRPMRKAQTLESALFKRAHLQRRGVSAELTLCGFGMIINKTLSTLKRGVALGLETISVSRVALGELRMTYRREYSRHLAGSFAFAALALLFLLMFDFSSGASAQSRRDRDRDRDRDNTPAVEAPAVKPAAKPQIDPNSPFGTALASCDKDQNEDLQLALPGLKGEVKLDRCYRGRKQLVCRFDAVLAEGKSLTEEFSRIVQERYPEVTSLDDICKISFEALVKDFAGTTEFGKRFSAARSEYDARTGCASKLKQAIQDVTLPDLVQAPEVLKSVIDAVDQEVSRVSVVQDQVSGLAAKIEASQKSIGVLQKIHRAMCLKSKPDGNEAAGRVSTSNM